MHDDAMDGDPPGLPGARGGQRRAGALCRTALRRRRFATGAGGLRLTPSATPLGGHGSSEGQVAYLGHRLQHHRATIETTLDAAALDPGELAGLALLQNETHHLVAGLEYTDGGAALVLLLRAGKDDPVHGRELARIDLPTAPVRPVALRLRLDAPRLDVDYALAPDTWKPLAEGLDASLLSVETAGGFIGNTFGPYAVKRDGQP